MRFDDMDELEREIAIKVWYHYRIGDADLGPSMDGLEIASRTLLWHRWVLAERLHALCEEFVAATPRPLKRVARWWVERQKRPLHPRTD